MMSAQAREERERKRAERTRARQTILGGDNQTDDEKKQVLYELFVNVYNGCLTVQKREELYAKLFQALRPCSFRLQLQVVRSLCEAVEKYPALVSVGDSSFPRTTLLNQILDYIESFEGASVSEATSTPILRKLFWLLGLVGRQSISALQIYRVLTMLNRVSKPIVSSLLLNSLLEMMESPHCESFRALPPPAQSVPVQKHIEGPSYFWEFSGNAQSALIIPRIEKWPCPKSYSVCMWVKWSPEISAFPTYSVPLTNGEMSLPEAIDSLVQQPRLVPDLSTSKAEPSASSKPSSTSFSSSRCIFSFLTDTIKTTGVQLKVSKTGGRLLLCVWSNGRPQQTLVTRAALPSNQWSFLAVHHAAPKAFHRSLGSVTISLDGQVVSSDELAYPVITSSLSFCALGTDTLLDPGDGCFQGHLGSFYVFSRAMSKQQEKVLMEKGPSYCSLNGNWSEKRNWLTKGVGGLVRGLLFSEKTQAPDHSQIFMDLLKSAVFMYHPQCMDGAAVKDLAPLFTGNLNGVHATALQGVCVLRTYKVRESLFWMVGGVTALLPFIDRLDHLSGFPAPRGETSEASEVSSVTLSLALQVITEALHLPANRITMIQAGGFAILGRMLLPQLPSSFLSLSTITALEHMCNQLWDETGSEEETGVVRAEVPLSRASERCLFNDVFLDVLLNFSVWYRPSVPFAVKKVLVKLVKGFVQKQPQYFKQLLPLGLILDSLRTYLPYQPLVAALDVHTIPEFPSSPDKGRKKPLISIQSPSSSSASLVGLAPAQLCTELYHTRKLRKQWILVIHELMMRGEEEVQEPDVLLLLQMCMEWTDSLQVAELLELTTELLYTFPQLVYPVLVRGGTGGTLVVLSILQRHAQHPHAQVACLHLLGGLLNISLGSQEHFKPSVRMETKGLFMALQDALLAHPLSVASYDALMEIALGLPPGCIGVDHACRVYVDSVLAQWNDSRARPSLAPGRKNRDASHMQSEVRFPRVLELLIALCANPRSAVSLSQLLTETHTLLIAHPPNCNHFLKDVPCWQRSLLQLLDWGTPSFPPSLSVASSTLSSSASAASSSSFASPPLSRTTSPLSSPVLSSSSILPTSSSSVVSPLSLSAHNDDNNNSSSNNNNSVSADISSSPSSPTDNAENLTFSINPSSSSSPDSTPLKTEPEVAMMAAMVIQDILVYSILSLSDGWVHWRTTLMFLRVVSEQIGSTEEGFRRVRSKLFCSLFHTLVGDVVRRPPLTKLQMHGLAMNLYKVVDVIEEVFYMDLTQSSLQFASEDSVIGGPVLVRRGRTGSDSSSSAGAATKGESSSNSSGTDSQSRSSRTVSPRHSLAGAAGSPHSEDYFAAPRPRRTSAADANAESPLDEDVESKSGSHSEEASLAIRDIDEEAEEDILRDPVLASSEWVLLDPNNNSSTSSFSSLPASLPAPASRLDADTATKYLAGEWSLIETMMWALLEMKVPIRPATVISEQHFAGQVDVLADTVNAGVRAGGPLRVLLRLILDILEAASVASPSDLKEILSALVTIVKQELSTDVSSIKETQLTPTNAWKNRFVLHVLQRLCSATYKCQPTAKAQLLDAISTIVDSLRPFAIVPSSFLWPNRDKESQLDTHLQLFLVVDSSAQFQLSPTFHDDFNLEPNAFSEPVSQVYIECMQYINRTVRKMHDIEKKFFTQFMISIPRSMSGIRQRLLLNAEQGKQANVLHLQAVGLYKLHSSKEQLRRRKAESSHVEVLRRARSFWKQLVSALRASEKISRSREEESAAEQAKFWKITNIEIGDGACMMMRKQLQICAEGSNHHDATQRYAQKQSQAALRKKLSQQAKKTLSASATSSSSASVEEETPKAAPSTLDNYSDEEEDNGVLYNPNQEETPSARRSNSNNSSSNADVLSSPKLEEKTEEEDSESEEVPLVGLDMDARKLKSVLANTTLSGEQEAAEEEEVDGEDEEEEGGVQSATSDATQVKGAESKTDSTEKPKQTPDWDMCTDAQANLGNPNSLFSGACTLVLPFMTIDGVIDIGKDDTPEEEYYLLFTVNHEEGSTPRASTFSPSLHVGGGEGGENAENEISDGNLAKEKLSTLEKLKAKALSKERKIYLKSVKAMCRRRYQLQRTACEIFLTNGKSFFFNFLPTGHLTPKDTRIHFMTQVLARKPINLNPSLSKMAPEVLKKLNVTQRWRRREISNFEYLMHVNMISGRTYNDLNQYPVFPWILSDYSDDVELSSLMDAILAPGQSKETAKYFRDLSKPVGALDANRLEQILERFETSSESLGVPPFHYGSHYSNAGIVLFYLMRLEPFASLHIDLQAGKFDYPDRLFSSLAQTWRSCLTSLSCFKELVPELFYLPEMLENLNQYDLGKKQDGGLVGNVILPRWAKNAEDFVRVNRMALESEYVSQNLHLWIDLIFGAKQRGPAAREHNNLFFYLTYEGKVNLNKIADPVILEALKEQIAQFGQTPDQIFQAPHPPRDPLPPQKQKRLASLSRQGIIAERPPSKPHLVIPVYNTSVIHVACAAARVFTLSPNACIASGVWPPSKYTGEMTQWNNKYPADSFVYSISFDPSNLVASACLFSRDARFLFAGNAWDNHLRVYSVVVGSERVETTQIAHALGYHNAPICCLDLCRYGKTLVSGGRDGSIVVWDLKSTPQTRVAAGLSAILGEGKASIHPWPRLALCGHLYPLTALSVDMDLDLCLSASAQGLTLLHSLRKGCIRARLDPFFPEILPRVLSVAFPSCMSPARSSRRPRAPPSRSRSDDQSSNNSSNSNNNSESNNNESSSSEKSNDNAQKGVSQQTEEDPAVSFHVVEEANEEAENGGRDNRHNGDENNDDETTNATEPSDSNNNNRSSFSSVVASDMNEGIINENVKQGIDLDQAVAEIRSNSLAVAAAPTARVDEKQMEEKLEGESTSDLNKLAVITSNELASPSFMSREREGSASSISDSNSQTNISLERQASGEASSSGRLSRKESGSVSEDKDNRNSSRGRPDSVERNTEEGESGSGEDSMSNLVPARLLITSAGDFVFYCEATSAQSRKEMRLSVCNINARYWRTRVCTSSITSMACTQDGRLIVTASEDGEILLRRVDTLEPIQTFARQSSAVSAVQFSVDEQWIFAGTTHGHMFVYSVQ